MKGSFSLFKIFGIEIKLHLSWFLVFVLLAWSLATGFFPHYYPDLSVSAFWFMGSAASLLLFVSVLLHELSHSLVAQAKKIKVESITLFFFGGVASISDEEMKPKDELQMALAGPLFSLLLAAFFFFLFRYNGHPLLTGITFYLYQLNLILAFFNLIPGYPLDGGRAFRALLYWHYHDLKKATYIAAKGGKFFAGVLIFLGIFGLVTGLVNGLWSIFLGAFLYFIAGMSYEQVVIKEALSKLPLKDLTEKKFPVLSPELTFAQALEKSYSCHQDTFVVQKGQEFLGLIDFKKIEKIPLPKQAKIKISQLMLPCPKIKSLSPKTNAYQAFKLLMEQDFDLLPVLENNSLKGVVTRRSLFQRLILELKYGSSAGLVKEKLRKK